MQMDVKALQRHLHSAVLQMPIKARLEDLLAWLAGQQAHKVLQAGRHDETMRNYCQHSQGMQLNKRAP